MSRLFIAHSLILMAFLAGCSPKAEPTPQPEEAGTAEPTTVSPENTEASAVPGENQANDNDATTEENTLKPQNNNEVYCGSEILTKEMAKDWTCVGNVWRCLNASGCPFEGKIAPMRTTVSHQKLYCNNQPLPKTWDGLVCLTTPAPCELFNETSEVFDQMRCRYSETPNYKAYRTIGLWCKAGTCQCGDEQLQYGQFCQAPGKHINAPSLKCAKENLPPGTYCKGNEIYCGETPLPQSGLTEWRCINDDWICMSAEGCSCGTDKTGKFGHCHGSVPVCEDRPLKAPNEKGYICQNKQWICADPKGCDCQNNRCAQFQACDKDGKCDGKISKSKDTFELCKDNNCSCGDMLCPKGAYCVNGSACVCGTLDSSAADIEKANYYADRTLAMPLILDDGYGEFECREYEVTSNGQNYLVYDVVCNKDPECRITRKNAEENTDAAPSGRTVFPKGTRSQKIGDAIVDMGKDIKNLPEYRLGKEHPDQKHIEKAHQALINRALAKCGRETAENFSLSISNYLTGYYNIPAGKTEFVDKSVENLRAVCLMRTICDTLPLPRNVRSRFTCDFAPAFYRVPNRDPETGEDVLRYTTFNEPMGLRCQTRDKACTCNIETCPYKALCLDGICTYDTIYADQVCKNVDLHLAPDEMEVEVTDNASSCTFVINPPGSDEYKDFGEYVHEITDETDDCTSVAHLVKYRNYSSNVVGKYVTANGSCICGYSIYTPKGSELFDYECIQSLGYVCQKPEGCTCGNARCMRGSLCFRDGECSPVVLSE